jgi:hypothetical protein
LKVASSGLNSIVQGHPFFQGRNRVVRRSRPSVIRYLLWRSNLLMLAEEVIEVQEARALVKERVALVEQQKQARYKALLYVAAQEAKQSCKCRQQ